jgi:hypothetical protein
MKVVSKEKLSIVFSMESSSGIIRISSIGGIMSEMMLEFSWSFTSSPV